MNSLLTAINYQGIIFGLVGGLGLFLYGIYIMGEALKNLAGDKMKNIVEKLTSNPLKGLLVGIVVTAIIQSSSGTTAITIGLVRAGLMTLPQSIGVIMGANIGTTVTAFLIGLNISEYSPLIIGVGAAFLFFLKNKKAKTMGLVILGFGMLFLGIQTMGTEFQLLAKQQVFNNIMLKFSDYPILGLVTGLFLTMILQSSSASTGIVQNLVESGALQIRGAIPILLGNNIGTTITAILAAIGGSIAAKRASLFHTLFNFLGAVLFMIILDPFYNLVMYIADITGASSAMTIAYAHIIFNVITAIALIWFVNQVVWLLKKIIPGEDGPSFEYSEELFNNALVEESPVLALESSKKAILHMGTIVGQMIEMSHDYGKNNHSKAKEEGMHLETLVNALDRKIHDFLVTISPKVDGSQSKTVSKYLDSIRDLERIGDHCKNLLEAFEYMHDNRGVLSEDAWADLEEMFSIVKTLFDKALQVIRTNDNGIANEIVEIESYLDRLEQKARKRHTLRINEGTCTGESGLIYVDLLSNLERIGDHCCNIAEYTLNEEYYVIIDEPEFDLSSYSK